MAPLLLAGGMHVAVVIFTVPLFFGCVCVCVYECACIYIYIYMCVCSTPIYIASYTIKKTLADSLMSTMSGSMSSTRACRSRYVCACMCVCLQYTMHSYGYAPQMCQYVCIILMSIRPHTHTHTHRTLWRWPRVKCSTPLCLAGSHASCLFEQV
jgi:hypothetical protein